ncbi:hypothetical protein [Haloferula sargassicola]|uniref:Uncharacterized protein n=1 Tax=Haloferula sargassicola TaxID=490096 RepID=A0ABP9UP33_9BACT
MPACKRAAKAAKNDSTVLHATQAWHDGTLWSGGFQPPFLKPGSYKLSKTAPRLSAAGVDEAALWIAGTAGENIANFAWVQHFIHHLAPQTAQRACAFQQSEASPQVVSVAKDNEPFEEKMPRLVAELNDPFKESAKLESAIRKNLQGLGYGL